MFNWLKRIFKKEDFVSEETEIKVLDKIQFDLPDREISDPKGVVCIWKELEL
jgi:hypothetical protein